MVACFISPVGIAARRKRQINFLYANPKHKMNHIKKEALGIILGIRKFCVSLWEEILIDNRPGAPC